MFPPSRSRHTAASPGNTFLPIGFRVSTLDGTHPPTADVYDPIEQFLGEQVDQGYLRMRYDAATGEATYHLTHAGEERWEIMRAVSAFLADDTPSSCDHHNSVTQRCLRSLGVAAMAVTCTLVWQRTRR